ncbi:hypothetical protein, partial [Achromobacter xylosoxidans]|uniref:hypothetical protein n=1 Tax=Alcaligenes xylosoxydans xylosoxydans TaxID=85698 RepID=UPI0034D60206
MQTVISPEAAAPQALRLDDSQRVRCEVWTRVMGYHRPVSSFNTGKQGEFLEPAAQQSLCLRAQQPRRRRAGAAARA